MDPETTSNIKVFFVKGASYLRIGTMIYKVYGIASDVSKEDGHFIETDRDGSLKLGHKGERLLVDTAAATPALVVNGVKTYQTFFGAKAATNALTNAAADAAAGESTVAVTTGTEAVTSTITLNAGESLVLAPATAGETALVTSAAPEILATGGEITATTLAAGGESVFVTTGTALTGEAALGTPGALVTGEGIFATGGTTLAAEGAGETLVLTTAAEGAGETLLVAGAGEAAGGTLLATAGSIVLPIVVVAGTGYLIKKAGDTIIDTRRTYEEIDTMRDHMTAPGKFMTTADPNLLDYKQSLFSAIRFSAQMDPDRMVGKIERGADGRITNLRDIDFTNGRNLAEFRRMLSSEISHQQKIIEDNSSVWPRWLRSGDGVVTQEMAKTDLAMLQNARQETWMFQQEFIDVKSKAVYDDTMKIRKEGAEMMSRRIADARGNLDATRAALKDFLRVEDMAQEKARDLPDSPQRERLLNESYMNCASVLNSLASAEKDPRVAARDLQDSKEYLRRAGLDPQNGRHRDYSGAFGPLNWQADPFGFPFARPEDVFLRQLRVPTLGGPDNRQLFSPDRGGYLTAQFGNYAPRPTEGTAVVLKVLNTVPKKDAKPAVAAPPPGTSN